MSKYRILFSGFADKNHSAFGGYDKILNYPAFKKILLSNNFPFGKVDKKYRLRKITFGLLDVCTKICRYQADITHLFYGEITIFPFVPYLKSKRHKVVATIHLDLKQQHFYKYIVKALKSLDGIITLSTQQRDYMKKEFNIESVFIPHGFDQPSYSNKIPCDTNGNQINPNQINLITIGSNYRDFETLSKLIEFNKDNNSIHFHIVGAPKNIKTELNRYQNVSVYNRISDDEYYTLIEMCDYSFLPLLFATANNTLLEAQSIGTMSILPNIEGISDYAAPAPLNLFYDNCESLIKIVSSLKKSHINNDLIEYSKKFNWDNIYKMLDKYYASLLPK